MKYGWIDEYCLSKKAAEKDFKVEWDATRYLIGGKMFAMLGGDKEKNAIITLKCEPSFGQYLREQYAHITAGYYMNKEHWNSAYLDGDVPDAVLQQMIDMSYELVLGSLSKKKQKEIIEGNILVESKG
ncbi:MmcQ/YjbR family DNA-binding protein [Geosporobacter ferrireducens]|uniref:DNA-binding protein n=1 Tax=Geosporobacter ferrireducens TaxID=1424294 RepID=A0A1D8GKX3_9FIRM|nr:MmcQ/YjbR family DNA-binding protein [Geosporobacter ferrireducens]AOT71558.1 DNA-binding protein [Geosporobacter ferrireducens]MTI57870.1 MmcQ/YjbR family DNA-binding protein [Geosporobacter ferrireducens]